MKSRSQTKHVTYSVDIDFDEASTAWNANKIKLSDGMYEYKKGGNKRENKAYSGEPFKNGYNLRSRKTI
jgi:hypothetical protein